MPQDLYVVLGRRHLQNVRAFTRTHTCICIYVHMYIHVYTYAAHISTYLYIHISEIRKHKPITIQIQ